MGINAGKETPWCVEASKIARSMDPNIEIWDPSDGAWTGIDWQSEDRLVQPSMDEILKRQLDGIASCDALVAYYGTESEGLGARLELGRLLMTQGLHIHLAMDPQLKGRHYIRAHYLHAVSEVTEHGGLASAVRAAIFGIRQPS